MFNLNLSSLEFEFNSTEVYDRITDLSTDYDVRYPLIANTRYWTYNDSGTQDITQNAHAIQYDELFPAVKISKIFEAIVKLKVPIEDIQIDDLFEAEAHVRIPTSKAGQIVDVSEYLEKAKPKKPKVLGVDTPMTQEDQKVVDFVQENEDYDTTSGLKKTKAQRIPEKTQIAYKLFRVKRNQPGKLFPLYVRANKEVPIGEWIDAVPGEYTVDKNGRKRVKSRIGDLAYRPGWHSGDSPASHHIGKRKKGESAPSFRDSFQVWAEVEVGADKDWQVEADARAKYGKDGKKIDNTADLDYMPEGGFYKYKTNPNMTGKSIIEQFLQSGIRPSLVPEMSLQDGIEAARITLNRCYFNEEATYEGVEHLRAYMREWDEKTQTFRNRPKHDQHSHGADAFRYMALSVRPVSSKSQSGTRIPTKPDSQGAHYAFSLQDLWDTAPKPGTRIG